jgi:cell division protein FtsI (penicillin-binding protein 3)
MRAADVRKSAQRIAIARGALVLGFAILGLRAAHLAVFDQRGAARGEAQTLRTLTLAPERGSILDRNGSGLALSVEAPSVYFVGREVNDPVAAARLLSSELGVERAPLLRSLKSREGFRFVRRWIGEEQAERIAAADLAGIGIVREPRRIYPHKGLAAKLIGFANIDGDGARGIEQREDAWLRGTTRRLPVERDGFGRTLIRPPPCTSRARGGAGRVPPADPPPAPRRPGPGPAVEGACAT